jgi:hypothetical protein
MKGDEARPDTPAQFICLGRFISPALENEVHDAPFAAAHPS